MASPGWVAVIEQVPGPSRVTEKPLTVQMAGVVDVRVTGSPELAVGATVTGDWAMVLGPGLVNVMVWLSWLTVKARMTGLAGRYVRLPGWVAVIEQVPAVRSVMTKPSTVQMAVVVEVSVTGRPELAVGATVTGD